MKDYVSLPGHFDEMLSADAQLRAHWQYLVRALETLGGRELGRRQEEARRLLHENGVTYNVYDDTQRSERQWPLDAVPVLVPSEEWSVVEQGLAQRAEMLELLLADLYGPQHLLRSGSLPAELLFAHPGFLRPCVGMAALAGHGLPIYAADLGRNLQGQLRVLGDRAQAPSGMGYALENRTVLSRIFPSLYRDSHVHRLALFFRALRTSLTRLAPPRREAPRVVLLTPGPETETYFEHAFLANYLGYALVQGSDLVVYDDCVWLKTLDGHKQVDVILRRVDDVYCDPLELRPESVLGTPSLLQAVRLGNVAIANPLGSSVLENPGWMPFLPAVCRELLHEDLKLPSVDTWWCGDKNAQTYVLENLAHLVIKPIVPHSSGATMFGPGLSAAQRQQLADRIRARPHLYVGQEQLPLSTVPAACDGLLEPRRMVLRAFAVAAEQGHLVMPGGLCRVAPTPETMLVSNQRGSVSKDLWVLASEPEQQVTLLSRPLESVEVHRDGDEVPGRVADDLFWLGRYAERTERSARLLREVTQRWLGIERATQDNSMPLLMQAVVALTGHPPAESPDTIAKLNPEAVLLHVLYDHGHAGTLRYDIEAMARSSRSVRDRLSSDASRVIGAMGRELTDTPDLNAGLEALQRLIILLAAFAGLCRESMTRGQAWRFLEIGRCLERATSMATLLRSVAIPAWAGDSSPWEALLAIGHSLKTYHRRYRQRVQPAAVLDLLLLDPSNPRSVAHQLARLEQLIGALEDDASSRAPYRLALAAQMHVRLADLDALVDPQSPEKLDELLTKVCDLLAELSNEMTRRYFIGMDPPQQLGRAV